MLQNLPLVQPQVKIQCHKKGVSWCLCSITFTSLFTDLSQRRSQPKHGWPLRGFDYTTTTSLPNTKAAGVTPLF